MLNSSPAHVAVAAYIVMHPSPHIMKNIAVPRFKATDRIHKRVANLSRQCHFAANNKDRLAVLEADIDEAVTKIWGISDTELKAIRKALPEK